MRLTCMHKQRRCLNLFLGVYYRITPPREGTIAFYQAAEQIATQVSLHPVRGR